MRRGNMEVVPKNYYTPIPYGTKQFDFARATNVAVTSLISDFAHNLLSAPFWQQLTI